MAITLSGADKLITLDTDTTFTWKDIYDACVDWAVLEANMQYLIPMVGSGKAALGGSVYTDVIFVLSNGWKLKPSGYTAGDTITITGTGITDDASDRTTAPTTGDAPVWVFQVATYGTISSVSTGSGLSEEEHDTLLAVPTAVENQAGLLTEDTFLALK
jgi:hypothetical protein